MTSLESLKAAIEAIPVGTKAAQLRLVMPEIDRRVREDGVGYQAIVDALKHQGLELTVETLRSYLYRWRKARQAQPDETPVPAALGKPATRNAAAAASPATVPRIENKGDLKRLREETDFDLDELAKYAKGSKGRS